MPADASTHAYLRGASLLLGASSSPSSPLSRSLQLDSQGNPLEENDPTRIGDMGVGTIVFLIINILYICCCCYGSMVEKPCGLYLVVTILYSIVMIFLFQATRTSRYVEEEETLDETAAYYSSRLFIMLFFAFCSCWTCCMWTKWHLTPRLVGKVPEDSTDENGFVKSRPMF